MPSGNKYDAPASAQLNRPTRNETFRPRRSASGPERRRPASATNEKIPMTNPTVWSEPPKSWRTCGPSAGSTAPMPRKPKNVAAIRAQKRPLKPRAEDPIHLIVLGNRDAPQLHVASPPDELSVDDARDRAAA